MGEFCECGAEARLFYWDEQGSMMIPVLKCDGCGDVFDAHEDEWIKKGGGGVV
jgi:hypothetical protein